MGKTWSLEQQTWPSGTPSGWPCRRSTVVLNPAPDPDLGHLAPAFRSSRLSSSATKVLLSLFLLTKSGKKIHTCIRCHIYAPVYCYYSFTYTCMNKYKYKYVDTSDEKFGLSAMAQKRRFGSSRGVPVGQGLLETPPWGRKSAPGHIDTTDSTKKNQRLRFRYIPWRISREECHQHPPVAIRSEF